jgi:hypothetical protein
MENNTNNTYYVVQYDHKYGSDVIGLFATQQEAELYARKDIIEQYFDDYAQEEDDPMPTIADWPEFTDGREYIAIHTVQGPGWWKPRESNNG